MMLRKVIFLSSLVVALLLPIRDLTCSSRSLMRSLSAMNPKRTRGSSRLVAARVGRSYRALGVLTASDEVLWFWIGPHDEYEKVLKSLT